MKPSRLKLVRTRRIPIVRATVEKSKREQQETNAAECSDGNYEMFRTKRRRLYGEVSDAPVSRAPELARERLVDGTRFAVFLDAAIVDRPARPSSSPDWLLSNKWVRAVGVALMVLGAIGLLGALVQIALFVTR